ncbi:hypothetical protein LOC70_00620 [Rhodopirellula sp. JC737]|nr:hypothetical protein [Rhodopirellula sp. JC737]
MLTSHAGTDRLTGSNSPSSSPDSDGGLLSSEISVRQRDRGVEEAAVADAVVTAPFIPGVLFAGVTLGGVAVDGVTFREAAC